MAKRMEVPGFAGLGLSGWRVSDFRVSGFDRKPPIHFPKVPSTKR